MLGCDGIFINREGEYNSLILENKLIEGTGCHSKDIGSHTQVKSKYYQDERGATLLVPVVKPDVV